LEEVAPNANRKPGPPPVVGGKFVVAGVGKSGGKEGLSGGPAEKLKGVLVPGTGGGPVLSGRCLDIFVAHAAGDDWASVCNCGGSGKGEIDSKDKAALAGRAIELELEADAGSVEILEYESA
jgi:hypothetical protein